MCPKENKPRILIVSDSPRAHSGLSRVTRDIFMPLHKMGKYHIEHHAFYDRRQLPEQVPWRVYATKRGEDGRFLEEDKWGQQTFDQVVEQSKPDIVFGFGDPWMVRHIPHSTKRAEFLFAAYCCIDSEPLDPAHKSTFEGANQVITFGEWPHTVLEECFGVESEIIPHGVQSKTFFPDKTLGRRFRKSLNIRDDQIIIGTVARNQARKNLGIMFEYLFRLNNSGYSYCKKCNKVTLAHLNRRKMEITGHADKCKWCGSDELKPADVTDKYVWYFHGAVKDVGWDMLAFANQTKTINQFRYNGSLMPVHGISDSDMNIVYNSMDIFSMPTTCEGFGLPIIEAMSAGIPVMLPDYSAYTDWAPAGGIMVEVGSWYVDYSVKSTRAYIDMADWIRATLELSDPLCRHELGSSARKKAEEYDYSNIVDKWDALFQRMLTSEYVSSNWRRTTSI